MTFVMKIRSLDFSNKLFDDHILEKDLNILTDIISALQSCFSKLMFCAALKRHQKYRVSFGKSMAC